MPERLSDETADPGAGAEVLLLPGESRGSRRHSLLTELAVFFVVCLLLGVVAALAWSHFTVLPGYVIGMDGTATTSERGLTEQFGADAWYCLIAVLGGVTIGLVAWWRLVRVGWPVILIALLGAVAAALLTWVLGWALGPGEFQARLAAARPGDVVPIELTLRAPVSVVVWPFMAAVPILLWSSLAPDREEPTPLFAGRRERRRRRHEAVAGVLPEDQAEIEAEVEGRRSE